MAIDKARFDYQAKFSGTRLLSFYRAQAIICSGLVSAYVTSWYSIENTDRTELVLGTDASLCESYIRVSPKQRYFHLECLSRTLNFAGFSAVSSHNAVWSTQFDRRQFDVERPPSFTTRCP